PRGRTRKGGRSARSCRSGHRRPSDSDDRRGHGRRHGPGYYLDSHVEAAMAMSFSWRPVAVAIVVASLPQTLAARQGSLALQHDPLVSMRNDSVTIRFVDTDLRVAIQALGRYLDRPIALGTLGAARVTLETPMPVPRSDVRALIRGLLESHNYRLVDD